MSTRLEEAEVACAMYTTADKPMCVERYLNTHPVTPATGGGTVFSSGGGETIPWQARELVRWVQQLDANFAGETDPKRLKVYDRLRRGWLRKFNRLKKKWGFTSLSLSGLGAEGASMSLGTVALYAVAAYIGYRYITGKR
jgi:hypothetical protein